LWQAQTLLVLYSADLKAAAVDLESKFSEAALGAVLLSDFRNFAHGRHHWLAERGDESAVLALTSENDRDLAERTLALVPPKTARLVLPNSNTGPLACLRAIIQVLHLVGAAGLAKRLNPGRPGVPPFGRRIYRMRAVAPVAIADEDREIERKARRPIRSGRGDAGTVGWTSARTAFRERLAAARLGAVIFDYDGTLCDATERFQGVRAEVAAELLRLLRSGVMLGIATGRGKSVREDLRRHVPVALQERVFVAYYNGSEIGTLSQVDVPQHLVPQEAISRFASLLLAHPLLGPIIQVESRGSQVSVQVKSAQWHDLVWRIVHALSLEHGLRAVTSTHSMDIILPTVSKRNLVAHLMQRLPRGSSCLRIGDRGEWPGNDFELLSGEFALSVDEVSAAPETCWNLAPGGVRGVQASLYYLARLRRTRSGVRFSLGIRGSKGKLT
jgi:hydroxymethylpyrimidine pyrophosphatase-like HAD family hydrolase